MSNETLKVLVEAIRFPFTMYGFYKAGQLFYVTWKNWKNKKEENKKNELN